MEDSIFLEPPVWQWHPTSSLLISLKSKIICCLTISTRPLGSNSAEIVRMLSLNCYKKQLWRTLFQLNRLPFIFSVSLIAPLGLRFHETPGLDPAQLQHWAQKWWKKTKVIFECSFVKSSVEVRGLFSVVMFCWPFLRTLRPHPPPWLKVSGQVPLTSQQPHLPETRFLFALLTVAARWQATTSKSYYDPEKSSLWFPVFDCMVLFFFYPGDAYE